MTNVSVIARNVKVGDRINGQIIRQVFRNEGVALDKVQMLIRNNGYKIINKRKTERIKVRRPAYNMYGERGRR